MESQDTAAQTSPAKRRGRPPKSDEKRLETREKLVRCGIEILTEQGFASTGIDAVLKQVGVPKGSFYHYFASKDDFGRAVMDGYADYFAKKLDQSLLNEARAPLDRLKDYVAEAKYGMARHGFRRGCLIGNVGQELGATHDDFRHQADAIFRDWQARVAACLEAAKATGDLSATADCARLAALFWIGWEGAVLRAKLVRSNDPITLFTESFFTALPR